MQYASLTLPSVSRPDSLLQHLRLSGVYYRYELIRRPELSLNTDACSATFRTASGAMLPVLLRPGRDECQFGCEK